VFDDYWWKEAGQGGSMKVSPFQENLKQDRQLREQISGIQICYAEVLSMELVMLKHNLQNYRNGQQSTALSDC
jgi:hypothetical protein